MSFEDSFFSCSNLIRLGVVPSFTFNCSLWCRLKVRRGPSKFECRLAIRWACSTSFGVNALFLSRCVTIFTHLRYYPQKKPPPLRPRLWHVLSVDLWATIVREVNSTINERGGFVNRKKKRVKGNVSFIKYLCKSIKLRWAFRRNKI